MENRTKFVRPFDKNAWRTMRFRKSERKDVDEALFKWFKQEKRKMYH